MYPQEAANIADAINGARLGADTDDKIAGVRAAAEAVADSIALTSREAGEGESAPKYDGTEIDFAWIARALDDLADREAAEGKPSGALRRQASLLRRLAAAMDFDRDAWLMACGFAPPAIPTEHVSFMPEPDEVLRTEGNAYAADGMTLMVAPLRTDGSIDHTQWAEYMPSGETERFWAVRMVQAIIAMRF